MAATQVNYVVSTADFNALTKQVKEDVRNLLNLTAKVYDSYKGIVIPVPGVGNVTVTRNEVRKMWKPVLEEIRNLRFYFNAAKRKKRGKKAFSVNAFTQPMLITDNAWNFFTTVDMGMLNPQMVAPGYSLDANGMLVPSAQQQDASNQPLNQYLRNHPLFGQKIARRAILQILFYIYARQHLLSGNANGTGVGVNIVNSGKSYIQWNTKYYGGTREMYDAFKETFDRVSARRGQPKLNSKGEVEQKKDGTGAKLYQAMDVNFFDGSFYSIAASDNVSGAKAGDANYIAVPDAATLKAYGDAVLLETTAIKTAMKAVRDAGGDELSVFRLPQYTQIAARIAPNNADLRLFAAADELQGALTYVNRLHGQNFKAVDDARQKYRDGIKKAQRAAQKAAGLA